MRLLVDACIVGALLSVVGPEVEAAAAGGDGLLEGRTRARRVHVRRDTGKCMSKLLEF